MLGQEGQGCKFMQTGLAGTRLDIASLSPGLSQDASETAGPLSAPPQPPPPPPRNLPGT